MFEDSIFAGVSLVDGMNLQEPLQKLRHKIATLDLYLVAAFNIILKKEIITFDTTQYFGIRKILKKYLLKNVDFF